MIYGAGALAAVAYRWKTQLNENGKLHAFSHAFPELAHNEIVAWERDGAAPFTAVVLRDDDDETPQLRRMIDIIIEQIAERTDVFQIRGLGETPAARAFSLVAMGDWASYHAARAQGIDATPVASIQDLKRRLASDELAAAAVPSTLPSDLRSPRTERPTHLEVP
jgi:glucose/mannose-6-phosphate isomerase